MFAVVRVRGTVGVRKDIADTLKMLRLNSPNHCVVLPEGELTRGMLIKAQKFITWGEIKPEMLQKLVENKGRLKGNKPIEKSKVKGYVDEITKTSTLKVNDLVPVFRLGPPLKGYRATKLSFPKGDLGYRKDKINDLIERMI